MLGKSISNRNKAAPLRDAAPASPHWCTFFPISGKSKQKQKEPGTEVPAGRREETVVCAAASDKGPGLSLPEIKTSREGWGGQKGLHSQPPSWNREDPREAAGRGQAVPEASQATQAQLALTGSAGSQMGACVAFSLPPLPAQL